MTLASVLLQRWQACARRCLVFVNILTRNNSYSVKKFSEKDS